MRGSANNAKLISMEEYNQFANEILTAITPRLTQFKDSPGRPWRGPVVLAIGDFKNKTAQPLANFSTSKDVMYGQIRQVIVNSGLATVNMSVAGTGGDVDGLLKNIAALATSDLSDGAGVGMLGKRQVPELILWGDIISISFRDGRRTSYQYALNVRLLDTQTGGSVFEQQVQLDKQFYRGWFGS